MILKKILPQPLILFLFEHRYLFKTIRNNYKKKLQAIKVNSFLIDDKNNWLNKLNRATYSNPKLIELAIEFFKSEITVLKDRKVLSTDIIAICVEKNDLIKLKRFLLHHRKLGINKFIILDNDSLDGTVEYLLKQTDVILLQTKVPYISIRRVAWINRIIAHYGYDRWYFIADSDELLVYNDYENKSIQDLIKYYEKNKIIRARAIILDMYADKKYYLNGNSGNYYNELIYFDPDSYYKHHDYRFNNIEGGCRDRVFNISPCLTKYPLVYFRKKDIYINSHFLYPYQENFKADCQLILKHYKFLPNELDKMKMIVQEENYYNKSIQYKHYIKVIENKKLDFFYKNTCKYINSKSLNNISIYKEINWQ